jgi:hypothetical protein
MKWRYFIGAAVLAGYGMLAAGAPVAAVAAGISLAALLNFAQQRRGSARAGKI